MFDGILIIDKPEGITSHDVVARCRRILRTKRIGHTGTLDPFATGVMVILVGKATRLAQFLDKDAKEYEAIVRFGFETDTGDRTGAPKDSAITNYKLQISNEEIETVLDEFRGEILQTPPMYSAKKVDGKKLYELARKGIEIERKAVNVKIYELESKSEPSAVADGLSAAEFQIKDEKSETKDQKLKTKDYELRVLCSAGTYIRVLAEDIGKKLNIGAHLAELRRTRAGKFAIEKSVTLEKLEEIVAENNLTEVLISTNESVSHLAEVKLSIEDVAKIKNGVKLRRDLKDSKDGDFLRLTEGENLLAIGFYNEAEKTVQPKLVLV
jgi:tRNA pseudouridine55 synthase